MISSEANTIVLASIGGLLIAISSTINLLFTGRITGMSGIFNALITFDISLYWKSSILSGLMLTSCIAYRNYAFNEISKNNSLFDPPEMFNRGINTYSLLLSGFLVGLGTKLANGCTSGHGVCGLPRLSFRSFSAVLTFMATAVIMANVKYFILPAFGQNIELYYNPSSSINLGIAISVFILAFNLWNNKEGFKGTADIFISFIVGVIFSLGLLISGMARKSKVEAFLTFNSKWDMSLMFVMGAAVMFNLVTFNYIINVKKSPLLAEEMNLPKKTKIDKQLIIGAAIFGLGWGLAGICPGPALIIMPVYLYSMLKFIFGMIIGQYLAIPMENRIAKTRYNSFK